MGANESYEVSNKIFTLPNLISFIRLLMIPIFLVLLFHDLNLAATLLFAIAASTDWVDGQVARRTNQVSRLGQLLDPAVDRLLMISGVLGLFLVGRLPLWIILFVVIRDLILLIGGGAKSVAIRTLAPSILGMDVTRPATDEYVAIGAARQAAAAPFASLP